MVGCTYVYRAGSDEPYGFVFSTTGGTSGTVFEVRTRDMQLARAYIAADPPRWACSSVEGTEMVPILTGMA